jgi:hypothetical protein
MKAWLLPLIPADNDRGYERYQVGHFQEGLDRIQQAGGGSYELAMYDEGSGTYCSVFFADGEFTVVTSKDLDNVKAEREKLQESAKLATR